MPSAHRHPASAATGAVSSDPSDPPTMRLVP